ncbi:MAG: restriction endonuclease-like protein [Pseudomonadales bacterium]|nr:restriction endonuclease-like protein [Pseudomonadales bacterium]
MPELIACKTAHYDFVVWSKDVSTSQKRLDQTLSARGLTAAGSRILLSPPMKLGDEEQLENEFSVADSVFFENKLYDIEFVFDESLKKYFKGAPPRIEHRLKSIEDSFHYSARSHSLRASINTGNDIGWFRIELVYCLDKQVYRQAFAFEVLPTKMDMAADLQKMNESIDALFPLWRFSLAEKTQQQMNAVKKPHPQFLLLWLARFEALWGDLHKGLKQIVNAPHSRLVTTQHSVKMDRLKGRLSPKLEQGLSQAKAQKQWDKRFQLDKKQLSVDTPENRFIKAVVTSSIKKLSKIILQARKNQRAPDNQRLSESFFKKLDKWQASMRFFQRQPVFKEIGEFTGFSKESLVLQQKPGYARVYRIWQELKWYLELLEGQNNLSLRSISELYEIWCFLEVRRILITLGFEEVQSKRIPLVNSGIEVSFKDGMEGSFHFKRTDGVKIRLAHEPKFKTNGNPIKSWITTQIPDIFLEASFPDKQVFVWIFDAKYRIKNKPNKIDGAKEDKDLVPDDAINQMHRYRDALIQQNKLHADQFEKSRPVYGAYALYPGFYDQHAEINPYSEAIEEIGIGAFSLLPSVNDDGSLWLTRFLEDKLALPLVTYGQAVSDKYFVEEAPRIPYHGTTVSRFNDLTIAASQLGPNRNDAYIKQFEQGEAKFYHTKFHAFQRQNIENHIITEARYLVVAIDKKCGEGREIKYIYPILSAKRINRGEISSEQAGTSLVSNSGELYWLFELGQSLRLKAPVLQSGLDHFELKLVGREELSSTKDWGSLEKRYDSLQLP